MEYSLKDRYFLNTRPRNQGKDLSLLLGKSGARILEFPTVDIKETGDWADVDSVFKSLDKGSWLLFTSSNGMRGLASYLLDIPLSELVGPPTNQVCKVVCNALRDKKIGVVGKQTAQFIQSYGLEIDYISPTANASEFGLNFVDNFGRFLQKKNTRVALVRGCTFSPALKKTLVNSSIDVLEMEVYQSSVFHPGAETFRRLKHSLTAEEGGNQLSGIILTSGEAAKNLIELIDREGENTEEGIGQALLGVPAFTIGSKTSDAGKELGFSIGGVSKATTIRGLVSCIEQYFA